MEANDTGRRIASNTAQIALGIASTGVLATLFYAGGVLRQVAYLGIFGAPWISRDITPGDVFRGGFEIVPSVIFVPVIAALLLRLKPTDAKVHTLWWTGTLLLASVVAVIAVDGAAGSRLSLPARSALCMSGAVAASVAAGVVSLFAVLFAVESSSVGPRSIGLMVVAITCVFSRFSWDAHVRSRI